MSAEQWFSAMIADDENDPEALAEDLVLDVTEQIYRAMVDAGLRPSDLAERLKVSRSFVSQLLNGRPNMTMRTLVGVAHALGHRVRVELVPAPGASLDAPDRVRDEKRLAEQLVDGPDVESIDGVNRTERMRSSVDVRLSGSERGRE